MLLRETPLLFVFLSMERKSFNLNHTFWQDGKCGAFFLCLLRLYFILIYLFWRILPDFILYILWYIYLLPPEKISIIPQYYNTVMVRRISRRVLNRVPMMSRDASLGTATLDVTVLLLVDSSLLHQLLFQLHTEEIILVTHTQILIWFKNSQIKWNVIIRIRLGSI